MNAPIPLLENANILGHRMAAAPLLFQGNAKKVACAAISLAWHAMVRDGQNLLIDGGMLMRDCS